MIAELIGMALLAVLLFTQPKRTRRFSRVVSPATVEPTVPVVGGVPAVDPPCPAGAPSPQKEATCLT